MATVYLIQRQMYFDKTTGEFKPRFNNLEKAAKFGEVKAVLSPTSSPFKSDNTVENIHRELGGITKDDYLLPMGNVTLVGIAIAIAAYYLDGRIKLLHWSQRDDEYIPLEMSLF